MFHCFIICLWYWSWPYVIYLPTSMAQYSLCAESAVKHQANKQTRIAFLVPLTTPYMFARIQPVLLVYIVSIVIALWVAWPTVWGQRLSRSSSSDIPTLCRWGLSSCSGTGVKSVYIEFMFSQLCRGSHSFETVFVAMWHTVCWSTRKWSG